MSQRNDMKWINTIKLNNVQNNLSHTSFGWPVYILLAQHLVKINSIYSHKCISIMDSYYRKQWFIFLKSVCDGKPPYFSPIWCFSLTQTHNTFFDFVYFGGNEYLKSCDRSLNKKNPSSWVQNCWTPQQFSSQHHPLDQSKGNLCCVVIFPPTDKINVKSTDAQSHDGRD